jgi:hypothetical protein
LLEILRDRLSPFAVVRVRGSQEDKRVENANGEKRVPILIYILVHGEMDSQKQRSF